MRSGNVLLLYCYVLVSIFIIKYFYLIAVKYRYRYIRVTLIDPSKFFSVEVYQFLVPQAHQAQLSIFFFLLFLCFYLWQFQLFFSFLFFFDLENLLIFMGCLLVCVSVYHISALGYLKGMSDSLGLELQMIVSQSQVLRRGANSLNH